MPDEIRKSYADAMKTVVSIPDDVFDKVDRFARRTKRSRSEVFRAAVREYIARHAPDEVTDAINRAVDEIGDQTDEFVAAASRRILEKTER
jgi:metal-responsive CopG/Arc/MetJ family transcriptional regulator